MGENDVYSQCCCADCSTKPAPCCSRASGLENRAQHSLSQWATPGSRMPGAAEPHWMPDQIQSIRLLLLNILNSVNTNGFVCMLKWLPMSFEVYMYPVLNTNNFSCHTKHRQKSTLPLSDSWIFASCSSWEHHQTNQNVKYMMVSVYLSFVPLKPEWLCSFLSSQRRWTELKDIWAVLCSMEHNSFMSETRLTLTQPTLKPCEQHLPFQMISQSVPSLSFKAWISVSIVACSHTVNSGSPLVNVELNGFAACWFLFYKSKRNKHGEVNILTATWFPWFNLKPLDTDANA